MKTEIREVKKYREYLKCDCGGEFKCIDQRMAYNFFVYRFVEVSEEARTPILYPHKCDKCGKVVELEERYPKDFEVEIE